MVIFQRTRRALFTTALNRVPTRSSAGCCRTP